MKKENNFVSAVYLLQQVVLDFLTVSTAVT